MTCENALILLSGHIDGVNSEQEEQELQAHLSECAGCRAILAAYEEAEAGLKDLETAPPEGFVKGVMYRIGQETGAEKKPRRRFIGPGTGIGLVAAMLVLLLGTGLIKLPKLQDKVTPVEGRSEAVPAATTAGLYGGYSAPEEAYLPETAAAYESADGAIFNGEARTEDDYVLRSPAVDASGAGKPNATEPAEAPKDAEPSAVTKQSQTALQAENMELCKQLDAPVLRYAEFGTELLALAEQYAPELGARLSALTPERTADGTLRFETDTRTLLALQEWLISQLPRSEDLDGAALNAEFELILRTQELDPDYGFLTEVYTLPEVPQRIVWPERWAEDWADRFRLGESWALCFPDEKTLPKGGDKAYLILADTE